MNITKIFVHGLESTSKGTKGIYFQERFPSMIVRDFFGNAQERLQQLTTMLEGKSKVVIIGSSYGGLVGAIYACQNPHVVKRLILLAPALDLPDFIPYQEQQIAVETFLFHGSNDDIVLPAPVKQIAKTVFSNLTYNLVDDDHSLHHTFTQMDWLSLLDNF
ncbi:MAG: alpha/beta fold hydrolase [Deltaproteobacteria bacterium]